MKTMSSEEKRLLQKRQLEESREREKNNRSTFSGALGLGNAQDSYADATESYSQTTRCSVFRQDLHLFSFQTPILIGKKNKKKCKILTLTLQNLTPRLRICSVFRQNQ
jgi:hypothetical protein